MRGRSKWGGRRDVRTRSGLMEGDDALTVAAMLGTREVGHTTVRNLLIGVDEPLPERVSTN